MIRCALSIIGAALIGTGGYLFLFGVAQQTGPEPLFFGEMWLREGMTSKVVLRPRPHESETPAASSLKIAERAGVDLLPLFPEKPPALRDLQQIYEAVELPFSVKLAAIGFENVGVVPPKLTIATGNRERRVPFAAGVGVVLGDESFVMCEIRPWGGLISESAESGGTPLAIVAVRAHQRKWVENIVAEDGDWLRLADELVFRFSWVESEDAALESLRRGVPGLEAARWGVEDNGAMNWFESFIPGTGLQLSDGTQVVLAEVREAETDQRREEVALRFKKVYEGKVQDIWVPANGATEDGLLRFSYPTVAQFVAMGYAWAPDTLLVALFENRKEAGRYTFKRGQFQTLGESQCSFRLDQVLGSAVYLPRQDSPLEELVLESDQRLLRLRQAETLFVNGDAVTFSPAVSEELPVYTVEIEYPDGKTETFTIQRDTVLPVGKWSIQQAAGAESSGKWATLYLERQKASPNRVWGLWTLIVGAILLSTANVIPLFARV
ncbi:MAG: hypothetical protein R6V12_05195 [Candidatus Hydrogenedentota bacterium]